MSLWTRGVEVGVSFPLGELKPGKNSFPFRGAGVGCTMKWQGCDMALQGGDGNSTAWCCSVRRYESWGQSTEPASIMNRHLELIDNGALTSALLGITWL